MTVIARESSHLTNTPFYTNLISVTFPTITSKNAYSLIDRNLEEPFINRKGVTEIYSWYDHLTSLSLLASGRSVNTF